MVKKEQTKEEKTSALEAIIKDKIAAVPKEGFTPSQMAQVIKESQQASLTERSIDDFLKVFISQLRPILNRMTVMDDEKLEDSYDFKILNTCFYQYFASYDKDMYTDIDNEIKQNFVSLGGRGIEAFENIAAGRAAGDVGLFRGIFNSLARKLFETDKNKIQ
jgi:hypothetical protein